jgi:hypothetical protein
MKSARVPDAEEPSPVATVVDAQLLRSTARPKCRIAPATALGATRPARSTTQSTTGQSLQRENDGWRVLVGVDRSGTCVQTRRGRTLTAAIPEVAALQDLGVELVLDGEVIVGAGRPADFDRLAGALATHHPTFASTPCFVAFDLLHFDGHDLMGRPRHERRQLLEQLAGLQPAHILPIVPSYAGVDLDAVLSCCDHHQLEGVVLKHHQATYRPGTRSTDWRKIKCAGWAQHRARRFERASIRASGFGLGGQQALPAGDSDQLPARAGRTQSGDGQ